MTCHMNQFLCNVKSYFQKKNILELFSCIFQRIWHFIQVVSEHYDVHEVFVFWENKIIFFYFIIIFFNVCRIFPQEY